MNQKLSNIFVVIVYTAAGAAAGYWGMKCAADNRFFGGGIGGGMILTGIMLLIFLAALYSQIILHEGGHLVCGLLSGYRFCSFRIGTHMFMKENGRWVKKTFTVAGTGGQCLMLPPDCPPEECPCLLYNMGGPVVNLISAGIFGLIFSWFPGVPILSIFSADMVIAGLALGILNMVPLRPGGIANDGYNAMTLKNDGRVRRALWVQLAINGAMTRGERLKDMEPAWFELSPEDDMANPLICAVAHYQCERLQDQKAFEEAKKACERLLQAPGLLGQQRNELLCMKLFLELIGPCRLETAERIYKKPLQKYICATKCYVSRKRLMYAWELLGRKDEEAARQQLEAFEQTAADYPFTGEVESERELMEVTRMRKETETTS